MSAPSAAGHLRDRVVVVGSINADTVLFVDRLSTPGETQLAREVESHLGGKGLSQAVAAAAFGAPTTLIGAIGDDDDGARVRTLLAERGIDAGLIRTTPVRTGRAFICVDASAENSIVVDTGANAALADLTDPDRAAIAGARILLTQFESGQGIAVDALRTARTAGALTILNAAPAMPIDDDLVGLIDLLVVNAIEATQLAGADDLDDAIDALGARFASVLVTLGERGGLLVRGSSRLQVAAPSVRPVDTTGAGDVSCGVLAAALAEGAALEQAVGYALAAGSLAVCARGNIAAVPERADVLELADPRSRAVG